MKLIIDIPEDIKAVIDRKGTNEIVDETLWQAVKNGVSLEDIKSEPYFWEKCPYYEPDMMFDGKDEYDCGKCKYKDKSVLEDIKAEIDDIEEPDYDFEGFYYCFNEVMKILDKHIAELKGENNDRL